MQPAKLDLDRLPISTESVGVYEAKGKLSLETVSEFIQKLRPEPTQQIILDMSGVTFLDSAGVGSLVSLFVSRRNHGKKLALAALTQQGNAVMQVSGLIKLLPLYASVAEAKAAQ